MRDTIIQVSCLIAAVAAVVTLAVVSPDNQATVDPYCEMVSLYLDSDGEFGWPDYRKTYHVACSPIPLEGDQ